MTDDDRGIATVWGAALMLVLLVVALVAMGVGGLVVTRSRAATIADLAAIAAAHGSGCSGAGDLARSHGMQVGTCAVEGDDVVVEVVAPAPESLMRLATWLGVRESGVTARARAGPSEVRDIPEGRG